MLKNLLITSTMLLLSQLLTAQQTNNALSNKASSPITEDWLSKAQAHVAASEYHFAPTADKNRYAVANKKQRTGFIIHQNGELDLDLIQPRVLADLYS